MSSLIYVEVGTGTGGIVLDLGTDGVACHVVQALNVQINSPLTLRLRGSGLKAEFTGELMWLSATRKDLGLRFKNPSAQFQTDIDNWIERESQPADIPPMENQPWVRRMSPVAAPTPAADSSAGHSLSAALALARSMSTAPATAEISGDVSAVPSAVAVPPNVAPAEVAGAAFPPAVQSNETQSDQVVSDHLVDEDKAIAATIEQRIARPLKLSAPVEAPSADPEPLIPAHKEPPRPQPGATIPPSTKLRRIKGSKLIPKSEFVPPIARAVQVIDTIKAGNWIPLPIRTAWNEGNPRQRLLLAGSGAVCALALIFVLVVGIASIGHSSGSQTSQAAGVARTHRHHNSAFGDFVDSLLGRQHSGLYDDQIYIQVWASKQTGFYYCTDTPYYKDVQPGAFMAQGDALQSGYRPILGQFCD